MGVASCVVAATYAPAGEGCLRARLDVLRRFYAPLGATDVRMRPGAFKGLLLAEIEFEGLDGGRGRAQADDPRVIGWGGPFPPRLLSLPSLLDASDTDLRAVNGPGVLFGAGDERARIVTSPEGPTSLYVASSTDTTVWSTHAVAAAFLCKGRVDIDPGAMPEFVTTEFVGGDRTHLEGVRAVGPALRIDIRADHHESNSYWPDSERWALLPEEEAQRLGEDALLTALERRCDGIGDLLCGLTAGLDSRVVAVALRELGRDFSAFTLGLDGWPDVEGAKETARSLGLSHRTYAFDSNTDEEARTAIETAVRWSEGLEPTAGFGTPEVPENPGGIVTGRGGETGRAFFFRRSAALGVEPSRDDLVDTLLAHRPPRLDGASQEAKTQLRMSVLEWIDRAISLGHQGWRVLDVVYGRERLTRWDRTRLMRQASFYLPALTAVDVQRALVSLPLDARLRDGFHRTFLEARRPDLLPSAPDPPVLPRPSVIRAVRSRLPRRRHRAAGPTWPFREEWQTRPDTFSWIRDGLLANELVERTFGQRWITSIRRGLTAGDPAATKTAMVLVAPLALAEALDDLNRTDQLPR